ncbi:hypothetical protein SLA2020_384900 [Shorea laevis]
MSGGNVNSVFYAESYHPIQAGSIDGTDILPHDNAVYRALLCSNAGLYDPHGDPKVIGDPYCTVFVGRLSHLTTEDTLHKAMSKYGRVKNLRLVRHIVTGASRGYAFVEFETEREMRRAYQDAHHSIIDDCEIIVDYNRQQLMPGWIPRRLGGGLGGKKESGQLRFGGRERPFRAPLRHIPFEDLKRLGIPPPPEGKYMSRFQVPSPPRRQSSSSDRERSSLKRSSMDREEFSQRSSSVRKEDLKRRVVGQEQKFGRRSSMEKEEHHNEKGFTDKSEHSDKRNFFETEEHYHRWSSADREDSHTRSIADKEESSGRGSPTDRKEHPRKRSSRHKEERSDKHHRRHSRSNRQHEARSP